MLLLDVVPYSLGIEVVKEDRTERTISKLIERNATIPIVKSDTYTTLEDNQRNVHIKVYQGESGHPHENHFLGDFMLTGIPPAPAHVPQIEVTFDIGSDCVLTVKAADKATGRQQSVEIEGAVVLSPEEKKDLSRYFARREKVSSLEMELERVRVDIEMLETSCDQAITAAESAVERFLTLFDEKMEVNPEFYKATQDQSKDIQTMFLQKDDLVDALPRYRDQLASIVTNLRQVETKHLDFSDRSVASKLTKRIETLKHYRRKLEETQESIEKGITGIVESWTRSLHALTANLESMGPLDVARHHLTSGMPDKARDALEPLVSGTEAVTRETFDLLLACDIALGSQEGYRDTHRRFGAQFGLVYPDFDRLNAYLKAVDDSVFMIQGFSKGSRTSVGSGFAVAPNLIATNRHVVEGMDRRSITVVGKHTSCRVDRVNLDSINDVAVLQVREDLKPLRLGGFRFVEPGEQVLALGFPSPSSDRHGDNIYISTGIVNAIREIDASSERVIFIDTKIGAGMSGGPLINALGEVVGILTLLQYRVGPRDKGVLYVERQPIALPIGLVKRYVTSGH
jgi:molecular chaperone DnaK